MCIFRQIAVILLETILHDAFGKQQCFLIWQCKPHWVKQFVYKHLLGISTFTLFEILFLDIL